MTPDPRGPVLALLSSSLFLEHHAAPPPPELSGLFIFLSKAQQINKRYAHLGGTPTGGGQGSGL